MSDTCTVQRRTGDTTDSAGRVTATFTDVYVGVCRVQQYLRGAQTDTKAGAQVVNVQQLELQVPLAVTTIQVGDVVSVTSVTDPAMDGPIGRVSRVPMKTHATMRRLPLEEIVG